MNFDKLLLSFTITNTRRFIHEYLISGTVYIYILTRRYRITGPSIDKWLSIIKYEMKLLIHPKYSPVQLLTLRMNK